MAVLIGLGINFRGKDQFKGLLVITPTPSKLYHSLTYT